MNLIAALCLLCCCVAPHACRSVDARDSPSQDLEPFVSHHRHEGNIAELLIPLLERSLAQSEARSNERQFRRSKAGKKVIQVLPYRGSEEHKRKGWRKLNSHKKQVVEITPLHGKNRAKPLAYILSAAKQSHGERAEPNDDVSSISASDLEQDKSSSEEQQSSEEARQALDSEDVSGNTLRTGDDASDTPGASSITQSSENVSSKESKDSTASDKVSSADATKESVSDTNSEENSEAHRKVVVIEESADDTTTTSKSAKHHVHKDHAHNLIAPVAAIDMATTAEEAITVEEAAAIAEERAATAEEAITVGDDVNAEEAASAEEDTTAEDNAATVEEKATTVEDTASTVDETATADEDVGTAEKEGTSAEETYAAEDKAATAEDKAVSAEDKALYAEDKAITVEKADTTAEERAAIAEGAITVEDAVSAEEDATAKEAVTPEEASTAEDNTTNEEVAAVEERTAAAEESESPPHKKHFHEYPSDRTHHGHNEDFSEINNLLGNLKAKETTDEIEESPEQTRSEFIENDIVISHGHHDVDSAEKSFNKLFNARARDIIELIQSSVEASTAPYSDCNTERAERHNHDHKSYRLSFLFNK